MRSITEGGVRVICLSNTCVCVCLQVSVGGGFSSVSEIRQDGAEPQEPGRVLPGSLVGETEATGSAQPVTAAVRQKGISISPAGALVSPVQSELFVVPVQSILVSRLTGGRGEGEGHLMCHHLWCGCCIKDGRSLIETSESHRNTTASCLIVPHPHMLDVKLS